MTPSADSSSTPTVLPPPPRRVVGNAGCTIWGGRLFCVPHMAVGVVMPFVWAFFVLSALFYTIVPAQVTQAEYSHSKKHGDSYVLHYQYAVRGKDYRDTDAVSQAVFSQYADLQQVPMAGRQVKARFFSLGSFHDSSLVMGSSPGGKVAFIALWVGLWDAAMAFVFWQLWVRPNRRRWLYKAGSVATGVVISKRSVKGKSTSYYIKFIYEAPGQEKVQIESQVWDQETWQKATEGEVVTVLFDPHHVQRAAIYEYGGYRVEIPPVAEPVQTKPRLL